MQHVKLFRNTAKPSSLTCLKILRVFYLQFSDVCKVTPSIQWNSNSMSLYLLSHFWFSETQRNFAQIAGYELVLILDIGLFTLWQRLTSQLCFTSRCHPLSFIFICSSFNSSFVCSLHKGFGSRKSELAFRNYFLRYRFRSTVLFYSFGFFCPDISCYIFKSVCLGIQHRYHCFLYP